MKSYIRYEDGYYASIEDVSELSMDEIFCKVAKMIAFSDCSDVEVIDIVIDGQEYYYAGWRPGMEYTFVDENNTEVWTNSFPEWDH